MGVQGKAGRKANTEGKMDRRTFPGSHTEGVADVMAMGVFAVPHL